MSELPLVYPVESPLDTCTICLGKCENKSFPKSCLHGFCFNCLLQWSKVKPECPLCVKPFSSVIHNIKSSHEYDEFNIDLTEQEEMLSSEFSESDSDDDSSWSSNSSDSSWYTISSTSSTERLISGFPSYWQQYMRRERARFRRWLEASSDESSWVTIDSEESSVDGLCMFDDIFSRHPVLSEQNLESLDAFLSSRPSDLAPNPITTDGVSPGIEEEPNSDDSMELSIVTVPLCEIIYRWLQGASPPDEENGIKDKGTALRCIRKGESPSFQ
ncbi:hypothetical protein GHT06_016340 [Daphnia sinensis]|uniref:E3 ubiquitin-protein ligase Topors n=1 Tax=Daphnia sinensis TaxID=1820382 RepID=A0AAD5L740_9CRUS|nr:hypothetical protein GHT06_016340 [Daphnia sinensis]